MALTGISWRTPAVHIEFEQLLLSQFPMVFWVMPELRLMLLLGTNTSPLGGTRVTCAAVGEADPFIWQMLFSVCWQGAPLLQLGVNDTPRMYLHRSTISCLSLVRPHTNAAFLTVTQPTLCWKLI